MKKISDHVVVEIARKLFNILNRERNEIGQSLCEQIVFKGEEPPKNDSQRDFIYRRVVMTKGKPRVEISMTVILEASIIDETNKPVEAEECKN
jgi:hypothetical protein